VLTDTLQIAAGIRAGPLPTFDELSMRMLEQGTPEIIWNKLVSQIALYYFGKWPTIGDSSHYREIGQKMLAKYPCIRQQGANEWVSSTLTSIFRITTVCRISWTMILI